MNPKYKRKPMKKYYNWMVLNYGEHMNNIGEINMTTLGEECAHVFNVSTEDGNSDEEDRIFEIAANVVNDIK